MLLCDGCNKCWHPDCLLAEQQPAVHDGPFICTECRGTIALHGYPDITLDFGLVDYLFDGQLPAQQQEADRIQQRA